MKALVIVIVLLLSINLFGSEKQDGSSQAEKQETKVSVPKLDLHAAIYMNNIEAIRQHIKAGSDLNVLEPSRGSTPLITAAALGNNEAIKMLIDAGASINNQNNDGSTALHTAIVFGKTEVAKTLIESGINLNIQNNDGSTALHIASFFCRENIVESLLQNGADRSVKNKWGNTAREGVESSFENVKDTYYSIGKSLIPMGIELDYEHIKTSRPKIAKILQ